MWRGVTCAILMVAWGGPVFAQTAPLALDKPVAAPPPPYEQDLLQLIEAAGSLTYLAGICNEDSSKTATQWRVKAEALIDAEAPEGERRSLLIGAFNRGYAGYALIHRHCTASTRLTIARLLRNAARLSRSIGARFGG